MGSSGDMGWGVVYDPRGICPRAEAAGRCAAPAAARLGAEARARLGAVARLGADRLARALAATFLGRARRLARTAARPRARFTRLRDVFPVLRRALFLAIRRPPFLAGRSKPFWDRGFRALLRRGGWFSFSEERSLA